MLSLLRVIADLHIHSRFSQATSLNMNIREISTYAQLKGLSLLGTGDFTHPEWLGELRRELQEVDGSGLFRPKNIESRVRFVITGEVCTVFVSSGKSRRIHHVIMAPNFDVVDQINDRLKSFGDLEADGRPMLSMSASELVEEATSISEQVFVFPAHVWTPWFSLFGTVGGFDSLEECYEDESDRIRAIETGLSSDPPMNWRLSALDRFAIISNSDSHSAWPWRIGREATVVDLSEESYSGLTSAISSRKTATIELTIETDPAYGKYHWSGHRRCGVSMPAEEARKVRNICPKCGKKMTKGVDLRVDELADRQAGYVPSEGCTRFVHLLPLHELIAAALGKDSPSASPIWEKYNLLVQRFGTEFNVMLEADERDLLNVVDPEIVSSILKLRKGLVAVTPGYDGVYGKIDLKDDGSNALGKAERKKLHLEDYL
jgi:uncharacterized protein (TIGR00375 family)